MSKSPYGFPKYDIKEALKSIISSEDEKDVELTEKEFGIRKKQHELDLLREINESNKQDRTQRKEFSGKIFILLSVFISIVLLIVISCGITPLCFTLSDTILITLLTTTTVNVIGIFLFVVRYLFKANNICPNCGKTSHFRSTITNSIETSK